MKMELVRKSQVKEKKKTKMFFLMIMMKDKKINIFLLGEVEQQNIRNSKSKFFFHSSFDYLFF
jgi:hypothetical protein